MVTVEQLGKGFTSAGEPVPVISGLSFQVSRGASLAVMGRSGSGKSTLLNLLCGLESPDRGEISLGEHRFATQNPAGAERDAQWAQLRCSTIGVVFQEANLMPALTLADNVRLRAHLAGQAPGAEQQWLERLGVGDLGQRFADQVSGGQRQRAALAMVFAMKPALILADEPTGSLDRHTADAVADCLFAVQQETGCTLLLATHDGLLAGRCDQLLDLSRPHDHG
ncbi:MAG: ABC transporter ATP-binding protein [Halomonadaceae bacterium]|nr:MAG: ABC transporter ATP-binding protein [Halomonadaceae bacterium]